MRNKLVKLQRQEDIFTSINPEKFFFKKLKKCNASRYRRL